MAHRYFTEDITEGAARITGEDAAHLARVLRVKPGQRLTLCDGAGWDYEAEVAGVNVGEITLKIVQKCPTAVEPTLWVEAFIAVGKGDKTDFAVQKAVELGASVLHPFYGEFSVAKPKNEAHKSGRYARIAAEAAKQSGRGILPQVHPACAFAEALQHAATLDAALLFHPPGEVPLARAMQGAKTLALLTGPEGGFSPAEVEAARDANCHICGLGPRILRCETAPLAALAAVMALTGNLDAVPQTV